MFVYLDESGDPGFKARSSRFFVVTILLVENPDPILEAMSDLRAELRFQPDYEFKSYKSSDRVRYSFMRMIALQDIRIRAMVVDKEKIVDEELKQRKPFYIELVRMILSSEGRAIENSHLIIDESAKSRYSKQGMQTYLRKGLNSPGGSRIVSHVRFHSSRANGLIQATDMISGAIYSAYERGNSAYLELVRHHIEVMWMWPQVGGADEA